MLEAWQFPSNGQFHRVSVEDLSKGMRWGEAFVHNSQEFPADVGSNIAAVWRVEPQGRI